MKRPAPAKIRISAVIAIGAAVLSGVALFLTAQKVQTAETRLQLLQDASASEKQSMRVLHAEWDYLNRPDRLEALARDHLNMTPPAGERKSSALRRDLSDPITCSAPAHKPVVKPQPAVMRAPVRPFPLPFPILPPLQLKNRPRRRLRRRATGAAFRIC